MSQKPPPINEEDLYYGLHEKDWKLTPSNAHLPLRADGDVTRTGSCVVPQRLLNTENSITGNYNSRVHRESSGISVPAGQVRFARIFPDGFTRKHTYNLKGSAARERVEMAALEVQAKCHRTLFRFISSCLFLRIFSFFRSGANKSDGFCQWPAI